MRRLAAIFVAGVIGLACAADTAAAQKRFGPSVLMNTLVSPLGRGLRGLGIVRPPRPPVRAARPAPRRSTTPPAAIAAAPAAGAAAATAPAAAATAPAASVASAPAAATPEVSAKPDDQAQQAAQNKLAQDLADRAYWPTADEDVIGYTFWPGDYRERLWGRGYDDIVNAVFVSPVPAPQPVSGTDAAAADATLAAVCGPQAQARVDAHLARIDQAIAPDETQKRAFAALRAALADAIATIRASCLDQPPATPVARLRAVTDRLWAIHVAGYNIRAPLSAFYHSLSDAQKAVFEDNAGKPSKAAARDCLSASRDEWPTRQIMQKVRLTRDQSASLQMLDHMSGEVAKSLMASCPQKPPATPLARLDAALDRLDALTIAANSIAPAFDHFYAQLSDEQKSRLGEVRP